MRIGFRKIFERVPVLCREWYPANIVGLYDLKSPSIETYTVFDPDGTYTMLQSLSTKLPRVDKLDINQRKPLVIQGPAENPDFALDFPKSKYIVIKGSEQLVLEEQWIEEGDDYIELVVKQRYIMPILVKGYESGHRHKDVLAEESTIAGTPMKTTKIAVKFKNFMTTVRYNKKKHTIIGKWKDNKKPRQLLTYSTSKLASNLIVALSELQQQFVSMVVSHLAQSFPRRHYDQQMVDSMIDTIEKIDGGYNAYINSCQIITWLRRYKRNVNLYHKGFISKLPLNFVSLSLTKIANKYNIPKRYVSELENNLSILRLAAVVGKSFNANHGLFAVSSKPSTEEFTKAFDILKSYDINYPTILNILQTFEQNSDEYLKYLFFNDLIRGELRAPYFPARQVARNNEEFQYFLENDDEIIEVQQYMNMLHPSAEYYISDTVHMVKLLREQNLEELIEPKNSLKEFHDNLSEVIRKLKTKNHPVPRSNDYLMKDIRIDGEVYEIRKPADTHEIIRVGEVMKHCVGSYTGAVLNNQVEIVVMYDSKNKPIVCMELVDNLTELVRIRQAKLSHNESVYNIPQYAKVIVDWAEKFKISHACADITGDRMFGRPPVIHQDELRFFNPEN